MPTIHHHLDEEMMQTLGITEILYDRSGGQKMVFIVKIKGEIRALKFYRDYNKRDIQENDIYVRFKDLAGIPKLIQVHEYNGETIVEEEYIEGDELQNIVQAFHENKIKVVQLIKELCCILGPLRKDGIIHRDIKPSNIIIKKDSKPVLLDFGIAKDINQSLGTTSGFQPHTWKFASPEQIMGIKELIGYRTDFFSLGVLVYFLYYGKLPFGESREDVEACIKNRALLYSDDGSFGNFFQRVFTINPSERVNDPDSFLSLL